MKRRLGGKQNESGIALFMVISTVALLGVLVTELTYSTQVSSRLAYNALDNAKAYYLAKAAYRFSLVRLSAYAAVKKFLDDPQNKTIKATVNPFVDRIWDIPFAFPPPLPKDAPASVADPVKEFVAESSLAGNYTAMIFGQSSKINFNNLFIKEVDAETESENSNTGNSGASNNAKSSNKTTNSNGEEKEEVNFRPMVETTISTLLNQKMSQDQEFAEVYRNVTGADVIDAIEGYLKRESRGSALPGYRAPETPKEAPFYDISELHMVPGINDEIYNLLIDTFTASATPGINVNMASRSTLWGLLPELTENEIDDLMRKRDDPDVGKPWNDEKDFWSSVGTTASGASALRSIQERFKKAGLKIITNESSFRIGIEATVGQSTRRIEAHVLVAGAPKASKTDAPGSGRPQTQPMGAGINPPTVDSTTKKGSENLQLVYWRSI